MPALPALEPPPTDGVVALRAWEERDVPALVEALQDPEIPRWTLVPAPFGEPEAWAFLEGSAAARASGRELHLAVVDAARGGVLGAVGLPAIDHARRHGEVGYWVAAEARGRGIATRAVRLLSRYAFETLDLLRLEAAIDEGNEPSQRVVLGAGFVPSDEPARMRPVCDPATTRLFVLLRAA